MHAARTGNMSHIRPLPLPNSQPKYDAHDHLRAVFSVLSYCLDRRNSPTNRNFVPFGQGPRHSLLRPMIDSNRVSQAAV